MNIATILDLVAGAAPERVAVTDGARTFTYGDVAVRSDRLARMIVDCGYERVAWLASNSSLFPVSVFAAAKAGVPFVPLNYRLADGALRKQGERLGQSLVVVDAATRSRLLGIEGLDLLDIDEIAETTGPSAGPESPVESTDPAGERAAFWLFTSGTTGPPKISVLRHRHLSSYILSTVELCAAADDEAILVSVPPYHIAGLASVLSSFFAARRMVYLDNFDAARWVETADRERITQAMVVPTMLQRIVETLRGRADALPSLRSLSYGGGRMPREVITAALDRLPTVAFANAYGLTETSSTITLLAPDDHRLARASDDPVVARRISSVGRPVPGLELTVRAADGSIAPTGERGEIWVRGPQVSGQYLDAPDREADSWFHTRDEGELDEDGYLYLHGRIDDVIVRGGENLSPGEIEDVLRTHPGIADVVVVAEPHVDWGEVPVAVVVAADASVAADELDGLVRASLRSSRIPARYVWTDALPYSEVGKVQRLQVKARLAADAAV